MKLNDLLNVIDDFEYVKIVKENRNGFRFKEFFYGPSHDVMADVPELLNSEILTFYSCTCTGPEITFIFIYIL